MFQTNLFTTRKYPVYVVRVHSHFLSNVKFTCTQFAKKISSILAWMHNYDHAI